MQKIQTGHSLRYSTRGGGRTCVFTLLDGVGWLNKSAREIKRASERTYRQLWRHNASINHEGQDHIFVGWTKERENARTPASPRTIT